MRYAVVGGDVRFAHLARMLAESGHVAEGFFQEGAGGATHDAAELARYNCIIANWPIKFPLTDSDIDAETVIRSARPGSTVLLCGPGFPESVRSDLNCVNLWADERLLRENAYLTAESAAASALHTCGSLYGKRCLVIGYGRIGAALTGILSDIGAKVSVSTRDSSKKDDIAANGGTLATLEDALHESDVIISTPPALVLDEERLARTRRDVTIIDVASPPYGVDFAAAAKLRRSARLESALPGRYCPVSAAQVLLHAIERWEANCDV